MEHDLPVVYIVVEVTHNGGTNIGTVWLTRELARAEVAVRTEESRVHTFPSHFRVVGRQVSIPAPRGPSGAGE